MKRLTNLLLMKGGNRALLIVAISLSVALGIIFLWPVAQEWLDRPHYTSDEVVAQVKRFLPYSIDEEIVSSYNYNTLYEGKGKWYGNCLVDYKVKKTIKVFSIWGTPSSHTVEEVHQIYLNWHFYEKSQTLDILLKEPIIPISELKLPLTEDTEFPIRILLTYPYTVKATKALLWEDGEIWAEGKKVASLNLQTGEYTRIE